MRKIINGAMSAAPFIICGLLLYAGLFIKPKAVGKSIDPPMIERRDRFYGLATVDQGTVWVAGNFGKIIKSEDSGKTWTLQKTPLTSHLQDIAAWDVSKAVAVGNQGTVIVTKDGGTSWTQVQAPLSQVANKLMRVRIFSDGSAWAVGEMGAVLVSRDFGATWSRASKEEDVTWNDIAFADGKNGLVVGEFGRMLRTADGGRTWAPFIGKVTSALTSVAFKDANQGVAVGLHGVVVTTANGGRTWTVAGKATSEHLFDVSRRKDGWVAVGDKGVVLIGEGQGSRWKAERLSELDLSWHTECQERSSAIVMAGNTLGAYENGKWTQFESARRK